MNDSVTCQSRRAYGTGSKGGLRDAGGLTGRRRAYGNLGSR